MRIILMFSSCCICYVQSSSLLKVLHGTYQYFERLTKLVELFTLSSKHPSWYSFFRRFARSKRKKVKFGSSMNCTRFCFCCECCYEEDETNTNDTADPVAMTAHERVVHNIRYGPYDRNGNPRESFGFTAFDLTTKKDVMVWHQTRSRLMDICNTTETDVRTVNLQFLLALSGTLCVLVFLKLLQQRSLIQPAHGSAIESVETRISNSSM